MFLLNGKILPVGRAFTHGEVQYPANWLNLTTLEEKQAIGITEEPDPVRADDRYYWNGDINNPKMLEDREEVDEDGNPMWVKVLDNSDPSNPVMVDSDERLVTRGLKYTKTQEVKQTTNSLLASTDWMVIRKAERDVAIPDNVAAFRQAVINKCSELETAIAAATTVEELIALDYSFPTME